ncbi:flavin-containing monooxygenase [Rhodococcus erythropolis]|jgi:cation diffusion facilitator CzcD-associated flavoprotein CzcO|uniref:flavin-containing monooxygenase n=1 Tax=Rhodococcus baikonurensis TaxID=172041 RepID=UPI0026275883|nr:NAD(P)/FAD-dependent oxidoreductase [uncultured Rhodococcus sp.]
MMTEDKYALIGAGPSGLAGARNLDRAGIAFDGFESHDNVGGLWDIDNPHSTVYESAHLISSKTTTAFAEFPMADSVADYPSHVELAEYFRDYADTHDLRRHFTFGTTVVDVSPVDSLWQVTTRSRSGETTVARYRGVIIANGTLSKPNMPTFQGEYTGTLMHTSQYRSPEIFRGKRVLVIGAGNSGCDIAVDAVHHAESVDLSVRRGYYFVPKYLFGRPSDTLNQGKPLPPWIKQRVDTMVLKQFTGDPVRFGFPAPDYKIYESHPVVNSLILHHLGHGDVHVRGDIDRFDGRTVHFVDGSSAAYDLVLCATGYHLDYPFIERDELGWSGDAPDLFLNLASRRHDNLFVLGMVEASGLGWQGRFEQAELVAKLITARTEAPAAAQEFSVAAAGPPPDLSGGYKYLKLGRMAYYVNKDAYRSAITRHIGLLDTALAKGGQ